MTFLGQRLESVRGAIEAKIATADKALLSEYPVEEYIAFFDALRPSEGFAVVPNEAGRFCQSIVKRTEQSSLEDYHRLALLTAMAQFDQRSQQRSLTPTVRQYFEQYFDAILAEMEKPKKRYYLHENDAFAKDFAVCRMKLWPCGVELVDERSTVPRRVLLTGNLRRFLARLRFFAFKVGGLGPLFETHVHPRFTKDFTPESYDNLYRTIAELLEVNPTIKGIVSGSWWHDPALEHISPNLRFLTTVPEAGGAQSFCVGTNPIAVQDATRFSIERTKLYKEGTYTPQVYLLVWARADLLRWARQHDRRTA